MNDLKKIIAIDPGISIGIAIKIDEVYITCTLSDPDHLKNFILGSKQVIYEDFGIFYARRFGQVDANGLETLRRIGRIIEICNELNIPCIKQHPQNRLAWIARAKEAFKSGKIFSKNHTIHEVDALAHLFSWEARNDSK